jgi:hypothetical protein
MGYFSRFHHKLGIFLNPVILGGREKRRLILTSILIILLAYDFAHHNIIKHCSAAAPTNVL